MILIPFLLLAIYLYIRGYKVSALVIFFFFITSGFNFIPEEYTDLGIGISKGSDFALLTLFAIVGLDAFLTQKYLKVDTLVKYILVFYAFLVVCIIYNKFVLGLSWNEIIRTVRYQFFWLTYLVFRNLEVVQLRKLLKTLYIVTVSCSFLFILQIVFDDFILVKTMKSSATFMGIKFPRFYNHPDMIYFFTFMSIYCNPLKGKLKMISAMIFTLALLGAFHRSLIGFFFLSVLIGWILTLPKLRRMQIFVVGTFLTVFVAVFVGNQLSKSRTFADLQKVLAGDFAEMNIDMSDLSESTFTFRMAHLFERNQYLIENPKAMFFGGGLVTEDSKNIDKMFDFKVGLVQELTGTTTQVDTGDISYSVLLLRFGYLGTMLNLALFIFLMYYFYKNRDHEYAKFSFLYFVLIFGTSFFSPNLSLPISFLLPIISYCIVRKEKSEVKSEELI